MNAIRLRKHCDSDGAEYVRAADVYEFLDENSPDAQEIYGFLALVEAELNYFNNRTQTAYGSPSLDRYEGRVEGYCMAKGWEQEELHDEIRISKGKKLLFLIEKPTIWRSDGE